MNGYKTTDGLMRHLRKSGIDIGGSKQKRQLMNTGYYHGYKGYRFFQTSNNRLPFNNYNEVYATIQYDSRLKALFYDKIMYIETAVKNIELECIMIESDSESIQDMYNQVICSYNNSSSNSTKDQREKNQKNKLELQSMIQSYLVREYKKGNPKITHFYNGMGYNEVPLWALFEVISMGDLGYLLQCLSFETRLAISKKLGMDVSCDTNRTLIYNYIYTLKDLRNAVAHNNVVFDARFCKMNPNKPMKKCLEMEMNLPYANFKTIGDYVILICYFLKKLKVNKGEIQSFIRNFEKITQEYAETVNSRVAKIVVHPDLFSRMNVLKKYI